MKESLESIIRAQIRERRDEALTFTYIKELRDDTSKESTRDYLNRIYSIRLDGSLRSHPEHIEYQSRIRSLLNALEALADDEPIYSWSVVTPTREFLGFSAPSRLILFGPDIFPHQRSQNDHSA